MSGLISFLLRFLNYVAVAAVLILGISVLYFSLFETFHAVKEIFTKSAGEEEVILRTLHAVDLILLGIILFIMGSGLYELFISPLEKLPTWLRIKDLDQLKSMLIKVIIVVIGVSFTGKVVTWKGETDMMGYGIAVGAVTAALSYFIKVKAKEREDEEKEKEKEIS